MSLDVRDVAAIQNLLNQYCHNADYNPPERMREVFLADAVFEVPAMGVRAEGVDEIIAFFKASRESNANARHVISNSVIEGDGDEARANSYLQVIDLRGELPQIVAFGRYRDVLRRSADGWRFALRSVAVG